MAHPALKWLRNIALGLLGLILVAVGVLAVLVGQPGAGKSDACVGGTVDPKALEGHVRMLVTTLAPRGAADTENLEKISEFLRTELQKRGGRVEVQNYDVQGLDYRNVIARFGPEEGERIVVGAHYDAYDALPGADDNASGVAGLLELATLLGKTPPKAPVELVAYTLEEPPYFRTRHMGSAVHANSLVSKGVKVRAMIAVEMIGFFTDEPSTQRFPLAVLKHFYPDRGNFIAVVGRIGQGGVVRSVKRGIEGASTLPAYSLNGVPALAGVDFSDHLNYWAHDMDAVMVTDTAFLRNRRYHTERDTPETLDYQRMADVVKGVDCAVRELSR